MSNHKTREKVFSGDVKRLRESVRLQLMDIDEIVRRSLENFSAKTVLDIGTGTGLFAEKFARKGCSIVGLDLRTDMINAARELLPSASFVSGDMDNLPFRDNTFDMLFFGHALHETDTLSQALQEAFRVTRKRVVIIEWPYREEEHGPPLWHRIKPDTVLAASKQIRFHSMKHVEFAQMEGYLLEKQ